MGQRDKQQQHVNTSMVHKQNETRTNINKLVGNNYWSRNTKPADHLKSLKLGVKGALGAAYKTVHKQSKLWSMVNQNCESLLCDILTGFSI